MKREIKPYNIQLEDCIPIYGIATHAIRTGANAPDPNSDEHSNYMKKAVGRAALLGAYQLSVLAGILGLENLILNS